MPVATTTALLIGAGIAGGTSLAAGAMGSHAAGKAADQQAESADKSLALQREMYQQQRADTAPWRNAGGQAVGTLSSLMGLPSGPVTQPQTWGPPAGTIPNEHGVGFGILQPGVTPEQARDPNFQYVSPNQGGPIERMGRGLLAQAGHPQPPPQAPGGPEGTGRQLLTQSGYATMQSPDGKETQQVPVGQVAHYEQMGARRVG